MIVFIIPIAVPHILDIINVIVVYMYLEEFIDFIFNKYFIEVCCKLINEYNKCIVFFGDWGLGIGDWANPQSPIPNPHF